MFFFWSSDICNFLLTQIFPTTTTATPIKDDLSHFGAGKDVCVFVQRVTGLTPEKNTYFGKAKSVQCTTQITWSLILPCATHIVAAAEEFGSMSLSPKMFQPQPARPPCSRARVGTTSCCPLSVRSKSTTQTAKNTERESTSSGQYLLFVSQEFFSKNKFVLSPTANM